MELYLHSPIRLHWRCSELSRSGPPELELNTSPAVCYLQMDMFILTTGKVI
jgi:hypothetical protein